MSRSNSIVARNEFSSIELRTERFGNGERVLVVDRHSGQERNVDVLALEGLVWAPDWVLSALADPSLSEREGPGAFLTP